VVDVRTDKGFAQLRAAARGGVDGIFALAGGEELDRCLDFVRPRGQLIHPNGVEPLPRPRKGIRIRGFDAVSSPQQFARLNRQLNQHRVHVPIAATYPLAHASRAHRRLDHGQVLGRIVLRIRR
jgi:NADPH2:quinone reductase